MDKPKLNFEIYRRVKKYLIAKLRDGFVQRVSNREIQNEFNIGYVETNLMLYKFQEELDSQTLFSRPQGEVEQKIWDPLKNVLKNAYLWKDAQNDSVKRHSEAELIKSLEALEVKMREYGMQDGEKLVQVLEVFRSNQT